MYTDWAATCAAGGCHIPRYGLGDRQVKVHEYTCLSDDSNARTWRWERDQMSRIWARVSAPVSEQDRVRYRSVPRAAYRGPQMDPACGHTA